MYHHTTLALSGRTLARFSKLTKWTDSESSRKNPRLDHHSKAEYGRNVHAYVHYTTISSVGECLPNLSIQDTMTVHSGTAIMHKLDKMAQWDVYTHNYTARVSCLYCCWGRGPISSDDLSRDPDSDLLLVSWTASVISCDSTSMTTCWGIYMWIV